MGYVRHHALLVTGFDKEMVNRAHEKAVESGNSCTSIAETSVNSYYTFVVLPDGSKEGWDVSDTGDESREALKIWIREQYYDDGSSPLSWAEIIYGDDDGTLSICGN